MQFGQIFLLHVPSSELQYSSNKQVGQGGWTQVKLLQIFGKTQRGWQFESWQLPFLQTCGAIHDGTQIEGSGGVGVGNGWL